ncbi:histidine phosphatase family protein [Virgisporangium aurantiacum]|uniref:Phosphoglycerate mutase n=1 Tax=Virgisporangium aurantiacum TaxID=175570 RepID=A0A8J3ZKE1_9ACTN|nr:histidine phosphatase family protein [Virgisporangium aurantiacum]GIJ63111.1 hypothetical protein Vau01_106270 [Virgisporangium aurantiacum]
MTAARSLIVVRHGRARCNDTGSIAGPTCAGLTDTGRTQATATAHRLAGDNVTEVHASTTPRALETAHRIAAVLDLPVIRQPGLRVPDPGAAEGLRWPDARRRWPPDPLNPTRPTAPDSEPWLAYLGRATATLAELVDANDSGTLLIVGHSETLTALMHLLLGVATLDRLKIDLDHCAITRWQTTTEWPGIRHLQQRWTLLHHNDTSHIMTQPTTAD